MELENYVNLFKGFMGINKNVNKIKYVIEIEQHTLP